MALKFNHESMLNFSAEGSNLPSENNYPASFENVRVLVAEDNEVNQRVLKRMLEKLGCKPDLAVNGQEAVNACSRQNYDIIFMDCQMPGLDGYEATVEIRKSENGGQIKIIAMTAGNFEDDKDRCFNSGMNDYLCKPVKLEDLEKIIKKWL